MSKLHTALIDKAQDVIEEIAYYPEDLNTNNRIKAEGILKYAEQKINTKLELGKSIQCKNCNMSLSEMQNSIALIPSKETELTLIQNSIVKEKKKPDPEKKKVPKKIELSIPRKMTVKEYRKILSLQLQQLSGLDDNETVEIDVEKK